MTEKRLTLALLAGGLISLILFWLMQAMISQTEQPKSQTVVNVIDFIKLKKLEKEPETKRKPLPKESLPPPPPPSPPSMSTPAEAKPMPEMEIPEVEIPQPDLLSNADVKLKVVKPKPKPKVRPKIVFKKPKVIKTKVKPKIRSNKPKPVKKVAKVKPKFIKSVAKVKPKPVKKVAKSIPRPKPKLVKKIVKVKPKPVKKVVKSAPKMASGISSNVRATYKTAPKYPKRAASRRQQGWVKIQFIITAAGTVKSPFVVASKPSGVFNKAALRAIRRWKFKPKLINGQRVAQRAVQTIKFKLR